MSAESPNPDPHATSDRPYVQPPGVSTATYHADEGVGTMIGPYKLLQLMGKGGMGAVWMSEQTEPVQRRVAVKIIKAGLEGHQVLARFEAERQALAMMDHPNIAKVLDAGATAAGRPYFVMELVKGIAFTKYCDQEHLTPKERLELFIPVCNAVQHAHQKGIIHRDLKPSNVLIALYDGKPVPKVIDFGIAKATHQKLTEKTMFTEVGQIVGTLEYMAPEQAEMNNLDIDTRADIYSLGVMLYELLTGAPPFPTKLLRSDSYLEMLRMIREIEPPKPSTNLSKSQELPAIAAKRKLEPKKLRGLVQGDLDWIVMKCLEKDRGRRYETANQLGQELQRFLADEPVQAGPPSVGYRTKKFIRRNKGAVIAASLVFSALVLGITCATIGLMEAERANAAERTATGELRKEKEKAEEHERATSDERNHALKALSERDSVLLRLVSAESLVNPETSRQRDLFLRRISDATTRLEKFKKETPGWDNMPALDRRRKFERENSDLDAAIKSMVAIDLDSIQADRAVKVNGTCGFCHTRPVDFSTDFIQLNEYQTWRTKDRHSKAYAVLAGPRGGLIAKGLGIIDTTKSRQCLGCHTTSGGNLMAEKGYETVMEGVSCNSCHGPPAHWLGEHVFNRNAWRNKTAQEKEAWGMWDLSSPIRRSGICFSCHVGNASEGKVVTHQMVVAGHPPLSGFELSTFSQGMPRHWRLPKEKSAEIQELHKQAVDFYSETRLVVVGSIAIQVHEESQWSAVKNQKNESDNRWPDFAQYDCASCHHSFGLAATASASLSRNGHPQRPNWTRTLGRVAIAVVMKELPRFRDIATPDALLRALNDSKFDQRFSRHFLVDLCSVPIDEIGDYDSARQVAWAVRAVYSDLSPKPGEDTEISKILTAIDSEMRLSLPSALQRPLESELPLILTARRLYEPRRFKKQLDEMKSLLPPIK